MAKYYPNLDREIKIGDTVELRGCCCAFNFDDYYPRLRARVVTFDIAYDVGLEFETRMYGMHNLHGEIDTRRGYFVYIRNLIYVGESDEVAVADKRVLCHSCFTAIDAPSILGSRLYKNIPMCDKCVCRKIGSIHSYHFAKGLSYKIAPDDITLGAEIEIDSDYDDGADRDGFVADIVKYARGNNYPLFMSFENDGSLNDDGVECVTAPLTIREWRDESVKNQLTNMFDIAESYGFDFSRNNHAGLHVHIGRKSLCNTDDREITDAVGLLMGWGATRLWKNGLSKLANRDENSYCRAYCKNYDGDEIGGKGLKDTCAMHDRYYFVNIQNSKTLELRVFNRATSYEDVLLAIDVCYMLAKWATKKINAFLKRNSYSAKAKDFTDALSYADRLDWSALVKFSKYPEITLPRMRAVGINV